MAEPVLCYVDGSFAYFTTKALADQWGDDWNDVPYEWNAGRPYGPHRSYSRFDRETGQYVECSDYDSEGTPAWEIVKVAWDGPLETPASRSDGSSNLSVEAINAGHTSWLRAEYSTVRLAIFAGTTLTEFIRLVQQVGGNVYLAVKTDEANRG